MSDREFFPESSHSGDLQESLKLTIKHGRKFLALQVITYMPITSAPKHKRQEVALDDFKSSLRVLLQNTPDVVMTLNKKGEIQYINFTLPEYNVNDVLGTHVTEYMPAEDGQRFMQAMTEALEAGESRILETQSTGSVCWLSRLIPVETDESKESVTVIATDITELKRRTRQQAAIAELGQQALTKTSLSQLMNLVIRKVAEVLEVEFCKVLKLLPRENELLLIDGVGWKNGLIGCARVSTDTASQAGYTLQRREPVIVDDVNKEKRFDAPPLLQDHEVVSGMSVVIYGHSKLYGVLGAHTSKRKNFSEDDASFLRSAANLLGAVIENAGVTDQLRVSEDKYRKLFEQSNDAIFLHTLDGRILDVNSRACELTGYNEMELRSLSLAALHPQSGTGKSKKALLSTKEHGSTRFESKFVRKDGTVIDVDISSGLVDRDKGLVQGIARDISRRKKFEQEITTLSEQNRWLAGQTIAAQEERKRIAQELHDELGQVVAAIKMDSKLLQNDIQPKEVKKVATEIGILTDQVVDTITLMMERLHPLMLRHAGLVDTLREMIAAGRERHKDIQVNFSAKGNFNSLSEEQCINIYRIVQEGLTNVVKHSNASAVGISLIANPEQIELTVQDNGRGVEIDETRLGRGMLGIRERVRFLGGELSIDSAPGDGMQISVRTPLSKQNNQTKHGE